MILISHRGNLGGPNSNLENNAFYIDDAVRKGYDVEIDLRIIDGIFYLGHDSPAHQITFQYLLELRDKLWIHCKNYEAIKFISECRIFRWFCHQNDTTGIVMHGYNSSHLWYSDLLSLPNKRCIIPLLSRQQIDNYRKEFIPYAGGICSDYIQEFR